MKVKELNSTLLKIMEFGQIPFWKMFFDAPRTLQEPFNFQKIDVGQKQQKAILLFELGTYQVASDMVIIESIEIDERKIVVKVNAESSCAEMIMDELCEYMQQFSGAQNEIDFKPVIQSNESIIIAHMDMYAKELIHPSLLNLIDNEIVENASTIYGKAISNHYKMLFRLDYISTDEILKEYRIDITPKLFSIEPRDGTPLDKKIYVSRAPVDTKTHIMLLEEIESMFS